MVAGCLVYLALVGKRLSYYDDYDVDIFSPDISIHILLTVLHTFSLVLMRRIIKLFHDQENIVLLCAMITNSHDLNIFIKYWATL